MCILYEYGFYFFLSFLTTEMSKNYQVIRQARTRENNENEIFITGNHNKKVGSYLPYITSLFQDKNVSQISLNAAGSAINRAVFLAEIVKRKIPGLHQVTTITSTHVSNRLEPCIVGLEPIESSRNISAIAIVLSKEPLPISPGYQAPLSEEEFKMTKDTFIGFVQSKSGVHRAKKDNKNVSSTTHPNQVSNGEIYDKTEEDGSQISKTNEIQRGNRKNSKKGFRSNRGPRTLAEVHTDPIQTTAAATVQ